MKPPRGNNPASKAGKQVPPTPKTVVPARAGTPASQGPSGTPTNAVPPVALRGRKVVESRQQFNQRKMDAGSPPLTGPVKFEQYLPNAKPKSAIKSKATNPVGEMDFDQCNDNSPAYRTAAVSPDRPPGKNPSFLRGRGQPAARTPEEGEVCGKDLKAPNFSPHATSTPRKNLRPPNAPSRFLKVPGPSKDVMDKIGKLPEAPRGTISNGTPHPTKQLGHVVLKNPMGQRIMPRPRPTTLTLGPDPHKPRKKPPNKPPSKPAVPEPPPPKWV
eukprot:scpid97085/ scgid10180/ 